MVLVALLDTSVLFPALLRDTLLRVAASGLYRPIWSPHILRELRGRLLSSYPHPPPDVDRLLTHMRDTFPDSVVQGYERLIPTINLPDPKDQHVVAAAFHGRAEVIVTSNLRHFPEGVLTPLGLEAQSPDAFLMERLDEDEELVIGALEEQVGAYRRPPTTVPALLDTLGTRHGLRGFAAAARRRVRSP